MRTVTVFITPTSLSANAFLTFKHSTQRVSKSTNFGSCFFLAILYLLWYNETNGVRESWAMLHEYFSIFRRFFVTVITWFFFCVWMNHTAKEDGVGLIGCVTVLDAFRGQGIASRLVRYATEYLALRGAKFAFVGYTYSGMERLYGKCGYRISSYYMMAKKGI